MSVTMRTIAEASGVSRPVVSHILNGRAKDVRIAAATVAKVLQTARDLGYCRNELARSVVTGKSRTIAFIAEDMGLSSYTGKIQAGLLRAAGEANYTVKVYQITPDNPSEILKNILQWCVAGVVFHVAATAKIAWLHGELAVRGIPAALVNLTNNLPSGFGVTTDDIAGARDATGELIRNGCREIWCVTYDIADGQSEYVHHRNHGYRLAMGEARLAPHFLRLDDETPEDNFQSEYRRMLRMIPEPDGVFAINDLIAMGLMQAAYLESIAMPGQLKLIGFGDTEMAPYATVPLSSVRQDFERMGYLAMQRLIRAVEEPEDSLYCGAENLLLPIQLIVRASSQR